jgi:VanZ family protein
MAFVFFVSSRARPVGLDETPDLLLHGGAYFVMAILAVRALAKGLADRASTAALMGGIVVAIAYGATDEWHQSFVPSRFGSWLDLLYDTLGALAAGAVLALFWGARDARRRTLAGGRS